MDRITISFPQLLPNGLQHTDDIADGTVLIHSVIPYLQCSQHIQFHQMLHALSRGLSRIPCGCPRGRLHMRHRFPVFHCSLSSFHTSSPNTPYWGYTHLILYMPVSTPLPSSHDLNSYASFDDNLRTDILNHYTDQL